MARHGVVVLAVVLQTLALSASARAQETAGHLLIGGGIVPLSISYGTFETDAGSEESVTSTRAGLGGDVLLAVGYGLGSWVLALETSLAMSVDTSSGSASGATTADQRSTSTELRLGPSVRYLLNEGYVRWFLEAGVGFGAATGSSSYFDSSSRTLYARGGPGLQIRLADPVSLDLALRLGYAAVSSETVLTLSADAGPLVRDMRSDLVSTTNASISETTLDVGARLSIWL